ncbi:hypothetical protein L2E82_39736 [Cichorium intybus]|uniref:Uncharacterized protein n=1 Tax=Cichorium intybus TaxID=13427 RepID=A0ACB9AK06_CICIN|nr:hypothetical protein L2E82_39736 [Cichorium intybus]
MEMKKEYGVGCEVYIGFLRFVFLAWFLKHSDVILNTLSVDRFRCSGPLKVQRPSKNPNFAFFNLFISVEFTIDYYESFPIKFFLKLKSIMDDEQQKQESEGSFAKKLKTYDISRAMKIIS